MYYMAEKTKIEEKPAPPKTPEKKEGVVGKETLVSNWIEKKSIQKGKEFQESKTKLKNLREKKGQEKATEEEHEKAKKDLDGDLASLPGNPPKKDDNYVANPETKKIQEAEKEALTALKEKQNSEIDEALREIDLSKIDEDTRKAIHADTLSKWVDVGKLPQETKEAALRGLIGTDGKSIDVKTLTPEQIEIVQRQQAKKYLESLAELSDETKKDPTKFEARLIELEKQNPGIKDFALQQKIELLTEKEFTEAVKKDPSIISETIESIKTDGIIATGIGPDSELGKKLIAITQGNLNEYTSILPEEKDITKLAGMFGGWYVDMLAGIPFTGLDGFSKTLDFARTALKDGIFREGILREDFQSDKEFQDALEKSARASTGLWVQQIEQVAKKISRSKLSPFMRLLADILAPIGAMMPGEAGEFWREYLRQSSKNQPDRSLSGGGGGNFEQLAEVSSSNLINAARQYLWRPYKMGGEWRKDIPWDPIDCSQLVVNSLIDTGCLPPWSDTTAMGFAGMSQKIGDTEWKEGDFLIMSHPSPHIAIITANLWGWKYKTIESASGKWGVVETERSAGNSFSVYKNPFLEWNGGIKRRWMSPDLANMKDIMKNTNTKSEYVGWIEGAADRIKQNQARYERVAQATGVPWELIGAIHYREWDFDFWGALHNGDKIIWTGRKTSSVPAGRWPFSTWEESAIDALRMKGWVGFTSMNGSDDQLRRVAAYAERYNGYGYRNRWGVSPYVWWWTPLYKWGRFIADHVYDANSYDKRPGVMPIILSLLKKNGVQPPAETEQKWSEQKSWTAADWFRDNEWKLYGDWKGKYDCMTSTHAALGLDYTDRYGGSFNGKYIDQKDDKHNLWNVSMASALYAWAISSANSDTPDGIIKKWPSGYYWERYNDPTNMEYYIEENVMKRTQGWSKNEVPSIPGTIIQYGAGYKREDITKEIGEKLPEGSSAMMGWTGERTNKWGHEWLVVKENGQLKVYESTKTKWDDWRGMVNGVNGSWYSLSEYLSNRESQHPTEAIIFSKK